MRHAKTIGWIALLCLTLLAVFATGYLAKEARFTRIQPAHAPKPTPPAKTMVESILAQAARQNRQAITADTSAMWVRIANRTPVSNLNRRYLPQETCFIRDGEKVVLVSMENDQVLLRYRPRLLASGSSCPDGTLFFVTTEKTAALPNGTESR